MIDPYLDLSYYFGGEQKTTVDILCHVDVVGHSHTQVFKELCDTARQAMILP